MNFWEVGLVLTTIVTISVICYICCIASGKSIDEEEKDLELLLKECERKEVSDNESM